MLSEINKDFYCSSDSYKEGSGGCQITLTGHCIGNCRCKHRKYPTPEQYKEKYRHEYPDDGAVYWYKDGEWLICNFGYAKTLGYYIVCACTPWGKPDKDWRPS